MGLKRRVSDIIKRLSCMVALLYVSRWTEKRKYLGIRVLQRNLVNRARIAHYLPLREPFRLSAGAPR